MQKAAAESFRYSIPVLSAIAAIISVIALSLPLSWAFIIIMLLFLILAMFLVEDLEKFIFAILLLSLPLTISKTIVPHPIHFGGAQSLEIHLMDLPLLGLYVIWFWETAKNSKKTGKIPPLYAWSLGVFLIISAFSMVQSKDIVLSIFELFRTFKGVLIFFYIAKRVNLKLDLNLIVISLLVGMMLLSAETLGNYALGTSFNLTAAGRGDTFVMEEAIGSNSYLRPGGSLGAPNTLAAYMVLLMPMSFFLLFRKDKITFWLFNLAVFFMAAAVLFLTMSRGAWLAFAVSMLICLTIAAYRRLIKAYIFALLVATASLSVVLANYLLGGAIWLRFVASDPQSFNSRFDFANIAFRIIGAHPILGVGLNNFTEVMSGYNQTGIKSLLEINMPVHNIYLLIASEVGLFGFTTFMILISALLINTYKNSRSQFLSHSEKLILIGLLGGMISILIQNLVDYTYRLDIIFFNTWFVSGLLVSYHIAVRDAAAFSKAKEANS